jgi:hypothetical protein
MARFAQEVSGDAKGFAQALRISPARMQFVRVIILELA